MKNAHMTKKWAVPDGVHFNSLRWPKTSTSWALISAPACSLAYSIRSGAGWPLVASR